MYLHSCHLRNLRRLRDVRIDLAGDATTFVGANNSGKTTAAQAFTLFLDTASRFSIYDFNNSTWQSFNALKTGELDFPSISLDLWFEVDEANLHRVFELLPDLDWQGSKVGIRIAYEARDPISLWANYFQKVQEATETLAKSLTGSSAEDGLMSGDPGQADVAKPAGEPDLGHYRPWPQNMTDYLEKHLRREYELHYYKLDESKFDKVGQPTPGYVPARIDSGARILNSLLRVDFVGAQRDLNDPESNSSSDDLSRVLSTFYQQNLDQHETDHHVLRAIAESEHRLNQHFDAVFAETLTAIRHLGYPGLTDPDIEVRSTLSAHSVLRSSAAVHYIVPGSDEGGPRPSLPEQYNGLGLKNLIFMVVQILGFHAQWQAMEHNRPPVHLILIEEPEAHLHAQVQQVFIRKIRQLVDADDVAGTQFIITTHSSHVVFEDFREVRYFRRQGDNDGYQHSAVLSLSTFVEVQPKTTTEFLQKYLRLTHCDLFFADAAVLVEGASERLLLPAFIHKVVPDLEGRHLSILEVGGAFAHKFKALIEFLRIPCLIITDLDSVAMAEGKTRASACRTDTANAVTSNAMLKSWLPCLLSIADLLAATTEQKLAPSPASVRVAYQTHEKVTWGDDTRLAAGRTFEEAFAIRNLDWVCSDAADAVGLRLNKVSLDEQMAELFELIRDDFDKTKFAIGMLTVDEAHWETPTYIEEGLQWLRSELLPADPEASESA